MAMLRLLLFLPGVLLVAGYHIHSQPPPQTRGKEIRTEALRVAQLHADLGYDFQLTCDALGVELEWVVQINDNNSNGLMDYDTNTIKIKRGMSRPKINKVFFHEIGHLLFHNVPYVKGCSEWMEPEADTFSFAVCETLGLEYDRYESSSSY